MPVKRPSVALPEPTKLRARELRASGLSYRAIVAQLEREEKRASLAAVHAACNEVDAAAVAVAEPPTTDVALVDADERAEELREIAASAVAEVKSFLGDFRTRRTNGAEIKSEEALRLMTLAQHAEKLARDLEGKRLPPPPEAPEEHTGVESAVLAAARAARGGGVGALA